MSTLKIFTWPIRYFTSVCLPQEMVKLIKAGLEVCSHCDPSTRQRAGQVFSCMDDALEEGGPHTTWMGCGGFWESQKIHAKVLGTEAIGLRARCPGNPQGKDTAQPGWHPAAEGRRVSVLGRRRGSLFPYRFLTGSTENRPCAQEPWAAEVLGAERSGLRARRGRSDPVLRSSRAPPL